jgi:hypothetical protein
MMMMMMMMVHTKSSPARISCSMSVMCMLITLLHSCHHSNMMMTSAFIISHHKTALSIQQLLPAATTTTIRTKFSIGSTKTRITTTTLLDSQGIDGDTTIATTASTTASLNELLSLPARPGRPLRVIISGGGVGGLTLALCLLKYGMDVTVYEKTAKFARFGGPIQFASNALSVLQTIDPILFERIMKSFTFTGTRTCGIKDGLRADGTFRMTNDSLDYLVNKDAPADWFVKFPLKVKYLLSFHDVLWLMFLFLVHNVAVAKNMTVSNQTIVFRSKLQTFSFQYL